METSESTLRYIAGKIGCQSTDIKATFMYTISEGVDMYKLDNAIELAIAGFNVCEYYEVKE